MNEYLKSFTGGSSLTPPTTLPLMTSLEARSRRKLGAWSFLGQSISLRKVGIAGFWGTKEKSQKNTANNIL